VVNAKTEVMMKTYFAVSCLCFFHRWRNNLTHLLLSLWIKYPYIKEKKKKKERKKDLLALVLWNSR